MNDTVLSTNISEVPFFKRGKVRDIYEFIDNSLIVVATDRISAFDVILPTGIPEKGKILTELCSFWFRFTNPVIPNHLISTTLPTALQKHNKMLTGRTMVVTKSNVIPIECVVRGWLSGSGWKDYKKNRSICGISLQEGLTESSKLSEPIFTPTTKAEEGHDLPMSLQEVEDKIGTEKTKFLKSKSIEIYNAAVNYALKKGIIIADTKFEFGETEKGIILIDELLTPDSSRFWAVEDYKAGESQKSFDKQFVRDYLESMGWNKNPPAPDLPLDIAQKTTERYYEAKNRLLGL